MPLLSTRRGWQEEGCQDGEGRAFSLYFPRAACARPHEASSPLCIRWCRLRSRNRLQAADVFYAAARIPGVWASWPAYCSRAEVAAHPRRPRRPCCHPMCLTAHPLSHPCASTFPTESLFIPCIPHVQHFVTFPDSGDASKASLQKNLFVARVGVWWHAAALLLVCEGATRVTAT